MAELELSNYFVSKKIPYVKPFYAIKITDKKEILDWFRDTDYELDQYYAPLFREQKANMSFFVGSGVNPNYATPFAAAISSLGSGYSDTEQVYINEMYRLVQTTVSTVTSNDLIPEVIPKSEDYYDRVACNVTKEWLDSMSYDMKMDEWRLILEIQKELFGESFVVVTWNPHIGDLHPDAKKYEKEELVFRDDQGNAVLDKEGKEQKIKKDMRIGDVEYINPLPWNVKIDPREQYRDSDWFYYVDFLDVDYLKKAYPGFNWNEPNDQNRLDNVTLTEKEDPERRKIYYFYHRAHRFLSEGRYIVASKEHVLVNEPLSEPTLINNQRLPLARWNKNTMGVGVRGLPMLFRNCKNVVDGYNLMTNLMYSNSKMASPKLFVHEDADVDPQRMPNGIIAMEWRGHIKPVIETPQANHKELFDLRDALKRNIDELAFQNPMVRGDDINSQMDSFVALQHYEDQRIQLATPDIKSHLRSMEDLFRLTIVIAKDNYQPDDGRMIKILGKHNQTQLKYFDPVNLQKFYDVRITTTGSLANSKAAKTQMAITLKEKFPTLISDETFVDIIGLSHTRKFINVITAAVSSAEAENQDMFDGNEVMEPSRYEDLIAHWETHRIPMQTLDFKHSPENIKEAFIKHLAATEKLMIEVASESETFEARLDGLRQFPMLYTPVPVNEIAGLPAPINGLPAMEQPPIEELIQV